ncbi:hypothetical protein CU098_000550, partial [Rhizopus stolonifer]
DALENDVREAKTLLQSLVAASKAQEQASAPLPATLPSQPLSVSLALPQLLGAQLLYRPNPPMITVLPQHILHKLQAKEIDSLTNCVKKSLFLPGSSVINTLNQEEAVMFLKKLLIRDYLNLIPATEDKSLIATLDVEALSERSNNENQDKQVSDNGVDNQVDNEVGNEKENLQSPDIDEKELKEHVDACASTIAVDASAPITIVDTCTPTTIADLPWKKRPCTPKKSEGKLNFFYLVQRDDAAADFDTLVLLIFIRTII